MAVVAKTQNWENNVPINWWQNFSCDGNFTSYIPRIKIIANRGALFAVGGFAEKFF